MIDIAAFTPRQLAGQRIMAGFDGTALNDNLKFLIHTVNVGGIILFARNIIDRPQLRDLCASAQNYAAACGLPLTNASLRCSSPSTRKAAWWPGLNPLILSNFPATQQSKTSAMPGISPWLHPGSLWIWEST